MNPSYLEKENSQLRHNIKKYSNHSIIINNQTYTDSILFSETQDIIAWTIKNYTEITIETIKNIPIPENGLLLIGTGDMHHIIDLNLIAKTNLNIECMNTKSACSTYTLLANENRPVVCALIL